MKRLLLLVVLLVFGYSSSVAALSEAQRKVFDKNIWDFNIEDENCSPGSAGLQAAAAAATNLLTNATKANEFGGRTITPQAIILHWTAGQYDSDPQGIINALRGREGGAKWVQLYVDDEGDVFQLTEKLETRPNQTMEDDGWNDVSIGIEIESLTSQASTAAEVNNENEQDIMNNAAQYQSVIGVVRELMAKYNIKNEADTAGKKGVFGHFEANAGNPDPGANFMAKVRDDLNSGTPSNPNPSVVGTCSCGEGSGGASPVLTFDQAAQHIWNFFISKGFQPWQAAGIMGNMQAESGLNPRRVQNTSTPAGDKDNITVDDKTGYGLVQWTTKGRQQGLADLAAQNNVISGDIDIQLKYVIQELEGNRSYYRYDEFLASQTVEEATNIILERYEAPKDIEGARPKRQNFARAFLERYGPGTNAGTASATAATVGGGCAAIALDAAGCPQGPVPQSETVLAAGIRVHSCVAAEVERVVQLAQSRGLNLSGWGWRDNKRQQELRRINGCPDVWTARPSSCRVPTAIPGTSRHERGTAIDFTCDGSTIPSRTHKCFTFLKENTSLKNLPSEPWHWSIDGK